MASAQEPTAPFLTRFLGVFVYSRRALELVWTTSRGLTITLAILTLIAGVLPAVIAYIGQLIVDGVVAAMAATNPDKSHVLWLIVLEAFVVIAVAASQRGLSVSQSLLRALLGQRVNVMILEKALTLQLANFEDSEFYDKLTQARREASSRPLSLVNRTFGLVQNAISLTSYAVLLYAFSPWAVVILIGAGLPSFFAEAKFSGDAFRLFRWRSPETRMQMYLETVIAREDSVKEVKLFGLGPRLLQRYRDIFKKLFVEDRRLTLRRDGWGFVLECVLRRLCVDRHHDHQWRHYAGCDDDVPGVVPTGPKCGGRQSDGHQRHVRRQPVSVESVRVPRAGRADAGRRSKARARTRTWPRV